MPISGLRVRLAAGFALAFAVGTGVLAIVGLAFLSSESTRRFDVHLGDVGAGLIAALAREYAETPDSSFHFVAGEVAAEWPANGDAFLFLGPSDTAVAVRDPEGVRARVLVALPRAQIANFNIDRGGPDLRGRLIDTTIRVGTGTTATAHQIRVVTFGSTEGIEADTELLGMSIAIGVPLILLASLLVGYLLAGRALDPVRQLSREIAAIAPTDLSRRLAPQYGDDELGALAAEFDALLRRLHEAQQRNRQFVREAAHQIRTPLTLVLGEAGLALDRSSAAPDSEREVILLTSTLARVRTAAEQMRRRVDELFLLAEARAGEVVRLEQRVELDGLVLECTDLMRGRASATGHTLAIGDAAPVTVLGNAALLQEVVLELIENACRHGLPSAPITVSCRSIAGHSTPGGEAALEVSSDGVEFNDAALPGQQESAHDRGLGLSIVRWVVASHHGRIAFVHDDGHNIVQLILPAIQGE